MDPARRTLQKPLAHREVLAEPPGLEDGVLFHTYGRHKLGFCLFKNLKFDEALENTLHFCILFLPISNFKFPISFTKTSTVSEQHIVLFVMTERKRYVT
jgi:hypothetical protein